MRGSVPYVYLSPTDEFIDELVDFLKGKRVLEIFAGNGYLASRLSKKGIDITATTMFSGHDGHDLKMYYDVIGVSAVPAVLKYGDSHDVLLVSWPTTTPDVLRAISVWGESKPFVYIGEVTDLSQNHLGGCATDEFFENIVFEHTFKTYKGNYIEHAGVCRFKSLGLDNNSLSRFKGSIKKFK